MVNKRKWGGQSFLVGAAIVRILETGLFHLVQGPGQSKEVPYLGVLFFLNAAGAALAAMGIYRGAKVWGWGLGLFVAGGALLMYVLSRTVGLPGLDVQKWFEPIGILSLVVEGLFVILSIMYLKRYPKAQTLDASSTIAQQSHQATS